MVGRGIEESQFILLTNPRVCFDGVQVQPQRGSPEYKASVF